MNELFQILIPTFIAFFATCWIRPHILKVAKNKNIVDNPDARKLQRVPIPVLGGLAVVFGIFSGIMSSSLISETFVLLPILATIIIILIVGIIDDTISLSPKVRFIIEILLVLYMIYTTGCQLNNFQGLWGVNIIPNVISIPLTVFACVGIINAINLIDGVDGYSSGYSIVSSVLFAIMFSALGSTVMEALAVIVAVSLLPFFLHNVFGKSSKMFIGDAGTLSLGIVFSVFVITVMSSNIEGTELKPNFGLVAFCLAILCVPIFDTLRVMSTRIINRKSPFHPDKTHLHHLFIELGCSHIGTALSIIGMNLFVVLCWYIAYICGFSVDVQLYIVLALGVLITFVFYSFIKAQIRKETIIYRCLIKLAKASHVERKGFWLLVQKWADRSSDDDIKQ